MEQDYFQSPHIFFYSTHVWCFACQIFWHAIFQAVSHTHSIYKLVHNCYVGPSFPFHRHSENSIHRPENLRAAYGTTQCIMKISPRLRIQSQVASQKLNTLISDRVALLLVLLKYGMNLTVNYWRNEVKLRVAKPAPSKVQAKLYHSQTSLISQLKQKTG